MTTIQTELSLNEQLIGKWLDRSASLEEKGLADWDKAFRELDFSAAPRRYFRSVAQRLSSLQKEGLIEGALLVTTSARLLEEGISQILAADLSITAPLWCTIQSQSGLSSSTAPSIKGEKLTATQLISLTSHLEKIYPGVSFDITAQPLIVITHQANVLVNSDRSVSIEVCRKGGSISRGSELLFRSETPPFQSWPFRCSLDSSEAISITQLIASKLPKIDCIDGHGEEFKPGYYEFSIGHAPDSTIRRVVLNDFRNEAEFTR